MKYSVLCIFVLCCMGSMPAMERARGVPGREPIRGGQHVLVPQPNRCLCPQHQLSRQHAEHIAGMSSKIGMAVGALVALTVAGLARSNNVALYQCVCRMIGTFLTSGLVSSCTVAKAWTWYAQRQQNALCPFVLLEKKIALCEQQDLKQARQLTRPQMERIAETSTKFGEAIATATALFALVHARANDVSFLGCICRAIGAFLGSGLVSSVAIAKVWALCTQRSQERAMLARRGSVEHMRYVPWRGNPST